MSRESLNLFHVLWLVLRRVVGWRSWPEVTSTARSSGTHSVSSDAPETEAAGLAASEMYYARTFCRAEVFPSHFTWITTFTAFGNYGKMERTRDSEKQETRAITVFFQNANSTTNDMCKQ